MKLDAGQVTENGKKITTKIVQTRAGEAIVVSRDSESLLNSNMKMCRKILSISFVHFKNFPRYVRNPFTFSQTGNSY